MTTMCLYLPKELKNYIDGVAKKKNISSNALIKLAITEYLEKVLKK